MRRLAVCLATAIGLHAGPGYAGDDAATADSLIESGRAAFQRGDLRASEELATRGLAIRERTLPPDDPAVVAALNNLAGLYDAQGRYAESEPLYRRVLATLERVVGPDQPVTAQTVNILGVVISQQGRNAEAEPFYRRAIAIYEKAPGTTGPALALSLHNLAVLCMEDARFAEAEPLYRRALAIREQVLAPDDPDIAESLDGIASLYEKQGRYAEAEPLYARAITINEKGGGQNGFQVASNLHNLAALHEKQGRYAEAEPLYRRAIAIKEKARGPDHPALAPSLDSLANLYHRQSRYADAEPLYRRALAIREEALGPEHPDVAITLNNLALLYHRGMGRPAEAEPLYRRALAIREKTLGPEHPEVATTLNNLALLYDNEGRYADAEPLYRRSLTIREKVLGPDHPDLTASLNNLAVLSCNRGRCAEAEPLYRRALAITEKALGPDHPDVAQYLKNLAVSYLSADRAPDALTALRRASAIHAARIDHGVDARGAGSEQRSGREAFLLLLEALAMQTRGASANATLVAEAFNVAQYASGLDTAHALAGMTARFAAGSDALAALVREREDLQARWTALDGQLVREVAQPPDRRDARSETALRQQHAALDARMRAFDEQLRRDFPRFAELSSARPAALADVAGVLAPDEALMQWTIADFGSFGFVVRQKRAVFWRIPITRQEIAERVASLRDGLDPHGRDYLDMPPFDVARAHELYGKLIAPALPLLADVKKLIVVADGALQSLPLSVLVTEPPKAAVGDDASAYRDIAWLPRRYALSVLPAASSLVSLRRFADARHGSIAFKGFGNPDFRGTAVVEQPAAEVQFASLFRGAGANPEGLHALPPLPETAQELEALRRSLDAPPSSLLLGKEATVSAVKALDLGDVRHIAFATHGLIAGELPDLAEPALALSAPDAPNDADDGLLRASAVAQLKLNADFVLLSACNTASSDGTPGAEGLSGLAKAFFYAGARSLLVSHWPVDSAVAAQLTTGAFDMLKAEPGIGRAEAMRRSMLASLDHAAQVKSDAWHAHPMYWAPFVVVGEGGEGR